MNVKRFFALTLVLLMLIPMSIQSFALSVDADISANWNTMAAKYSKGTWKIIAPKASGNNIKTDGFTFNTADNGGIKVVTPDYKTFAGTYGVSAVTSKVKTPLDGLSIVITPDEYDSMLDGLKAGNIIGVLWTEEKINEIAKYNETTSAYDKGLYTAVQAYDTGLRHLIPMAENAVPHTPAFDATAAPIGQALYISLTCNVAQADNAPIATSVRIVYYDGYYMNDDGNPGYRWIFTARNHSDTLNSDSTRLSQPYESVDLSKGLAINVRADEMLGFIVNINGYDYYRGEDVGYFPDAKQDWYGYRTNDLNDDKIEESDPLYLSTMTYAKADIDLSGLKTAGDGYVTVGAVSNNDQNLEGHGCNYTVDTINGIPAASWNGETVPEHTCDYKFIETVAPNCTRNGYDYFRCTVCGKNMTTNSTNKLEHIVGEMKEFETPACDNYGTMAAHCTLCKRIVESYAIPKTEHNFTDEVTVIKEATCDKNGIVKKHCNTCSKDYEIIVPADPTSHITENEKPVIEEIDGATDWFGKISGTCSSCGNAVDEMINMYEIVEHFTDIKENSWFMSEVAYCVRQGYVSGMSDTTFVPNGNLTRAQYLTLLAKFDGVDLTKYESTNAGFTDVKIDHWFNEVVCWAVENEYTSGIGNGKFGPNNNITRAQLARFFYVYTQKKGKDTSDRADISGFEDSGKVQDWAIEPVKWAVSTGLITGISSTTLAPNATATRAQAARIFMIYANTAFENAECLHEYGEWNIIKEPSYAEEGTKEKSCINCGSVVTESIPKLVCEEHDWSEWTLNDNGYRERICFICAVTEIDSTLISELFTITFDPNGGELPEGMTNIYTVFKGMTVYDAIQTYDYPTPTNPDGLVFQGWLIDIYDITIHESEWQNIVNQTVTFNITFTAEWTDNTDYVPEFTINFDAQDAAIINDTPISYNIALGDEFANVILELPIAEKNGYIFKGWYNSDFRIAITGEDDGIFDIYIPANPDTGLPMFTLKEMNRNITLIPIWETAGEKDSFFVFENPSIEGFEPITYEFKAGNSFMSIFAGKVPHPGEITIDDNGDIYEFCGWRIEELNYLLTEDDLWSTTSVVFSGNWTFIAYYEIL